MDPKVEKVLKSRTDAANFGKLAAVNNDRLHAFVADAVELCAPDKVLVLDDSPASVALTREHAVKSGEETLGISDRFNNIEIMLPHLALSYHELGNTEKFEFYRDRCNREFPDLSWTKQLNKL